MKNISIYTLVSSSSKIIYNSKIADRLYSMTYVVGDIDIIVVHNNNYQIPTQLFRQF